MIAAVGGDRKLKCVEGVEVEADLKIVPALYDQHNFSTDQQHTCTSATFIRNTFAFIFNSSWKSLPLYDHKLVGN